MTTLSWPIPSLSHAAEGLYQPADPSTFVPRPAINFGDVSVLAVERGDSNDVVILNETVPVTEPTYSERIGEGMRVLRRKLDLMFPSRVASITRGRTTLNDYEDGGEAKELHVFIAEIIGGASMELAEAEAALYEDLIEFGDSTTSRDITIDLRGTNG